jgi:putative ABC transport system permease protein
MGITNGRLTGMILLQAFTAGTLGFALGTGMAATFFELTLRQLPMRGMVLMWQCVALTGASILLVVIVASVLSIRRVLVLEPASVFRT